MDARAAAEVEKAFAAERAVAGIRVLIIAFNSLVYHFMMPKAGTYPAVAYAIIAAANLYGVAVYFGQPYRRFPALMSSYFTSALDAGFISIWIFATGGVGSPFHLLWLASVTATAFRYGMRETFFAAGLYALSYVLLLAGLGQLAGNVTVITVRVGYIFFVAAIGGLLARESFRQTREKVELRAMTAALRESEDRFRRLADAAFEGIAFHEKGVFIESNAAFARMFGFSVDEIVGRPVLDLVAPESRASIQERLRVHDDRPYETRGLRRDGSRFDVEVVGRDVPYQGRVVRVVAAQDVTERKAQRALAARNERLQEIDRMKTQFINNAAHELATPLTPIKLQSHLLRIGTLGPLNEKQQRAVQVVARNADHLTHVVKDVLDSARIQAGRVDVRRTTLDLAHVAREVVDSFADSASAVLVDLSVDAPKPVVLDADGPRIAQVLYNYLGNALKFTPEGGRVVVRVREAAGEGVIEVADSGPGLAAEDIPKLFQAFSQLHEEDRPQKGGTGLGLYISRGIVEAHGGRVWATSEGLGRGATFALALPRA